VRNIKIFLGVKKICFWNVTASTFMSYCWLHTSISHLWRNPFCIYKTFV